MNTEQPQVQTTFEALVTAIARRVCEELLAQRDARDAAEPVPMKELYTVSELADRYSVSADTIYDMINAGKFGDVVTVGKFKRVTAVGVRAYDAASTGPARSASARPKKRRRARSHVDPGPI